MSIEAVPVTEVESARILRTYFDDIIGRYHRRAATDAEIDAAMAADPGDDLVLLLARDGGETAGCVGLRFARPPFAEVKRMFVVSSARGRGLGQALLAAAEDVALKHGAVAMRLDTRHDLVEARALYAKCGYSEVEPFSDDPYAEHWFQKDLLTLGPVAADDFRLAELITALDRELWDRYGNEDLGPSPATPDVRFILACLGVTPVGCVAVQPHGGDFELKRMYVSPAARGSGVAPRLVSAAAEVAAGARLVLETGVRQPEAIRLYEKCGFTRIPNYPPYDTDPLSVCYARSL